MATGTLPDSDEDKTISPDESDELFNRVYGDDVARGINDAENAAATGGADDDKSVDDKENDPSAPPGGWHNGVVPGGNKGEKGNVWTRMSRNKKWLAGLGIGGAGVSIPLIILSIMPLRMEMMIQNITGLASKVPEYAVQQRSEYIITRALAVRLLGAANNTLDAESKLVFCKGGGVACSLFATYSNDYFEKKYGIEFKAEADGRTSLGGNAKNWTVDVKKGDTDVDSVVKKITTNGEMKKLIFKELDRDKIPNVVDRFLARRLLMKKFGVTTWRGPKAVENGVNKLSTIKTNLKTSIAKNTTNKIAPRLTTYITCLTDPAVCKNLREINATKTPTTIKDPATDPELADLDHDSPEYKARVEAYNQQVNLQGLASGATETAEEIATETVAKNVITKKVIALAGGAGAAIGLLDLAFSAINSVAEGSLSEINYDITTQVYTGFAAEIQTANEQMKAGDADLDTIGVLNSYFDSGNVPSGTVSAADTLNDGVDSSPLYQAESGQTVDTSKGLTVPCDDVNGNKVNTKLAPGELICDDQKVVRNYSQYFDKDPTGVVLAGAAKVWKSSVGAVIDTVGKAFGDVLNAIPGFKEAVSGIMSLFKDGIDGIVNWVVGLFSKTPNVGPTASGADNHAALSAGIRVTNNALMEEGVDEEGNAMGGGGTVQTDATVARITDEQNRAEQDVFNSKPLLARIFDAQLTGSFVQQFVSRLPLSIESVARLPYSSLSQLFSNASAATDSAVINPFNLPLYGYAPGDPALTADPGTYTEEQCAASAQARIDSKYKDVSKGEIIAVYHKSDPCALEKMVVGSQLEVNGITDDTYSLKPVTAETGIIKVRQASMEKPSITTPRGNGWTLSPGVDYSTYVCDSRTKDIGTYKNPDLGFTVRLCEITAFPSSSGTDIGASNANVVASVISANVMNMFTDAKAAGVSLGVTDGMRSKESGDYTSFSQHGRGLAIDIGSPRGGQTICFTAGGFSSKAAAEAACSGNAAYAWLKANASKYGFQNLMNTLHEPWHWSMGES